MKKFSYKKPSACSHCTKQPYILSAHDTLWVCKLLGPSTILRSPGATDSFPVYKLNVNRVDNATFTLKDIWVACGYVNTRPKRVLASCAPVPHMALNVLTYLLYTYIFIIYLLIFNNNRFVLNVD